MIKPANFINHPYLVSDWSERDLAKIRNIRKDASKNSLIDNKEVRKFAQRRVKCCTILLEYFYGTGRFMSSIPANAFPIELHDELSAILVLATNPCYESVSDET